MTELISKCFATFITANWSTGNFSAPDTITALANDESPGKYKGRLNKSCILINMGNIRFTSVDIGVKFRTWDTTVYLHHTSSANLQGMFDEFERIVHLWEKNGGGTFSSNDSDNMKVIDFMDFDAHNDYDADIPMTFRSFYKEE